MPNPHAMIKEGPIADSLSTIKRLDKDGIMYTMQCNYDYYAAGNPALSVLDAFCSAFTTFNMSGENLLCRNYDLRHYTGADRENGSVTGLNAVVRCENPSAKYKSLSVVDAYWLDRQHGRFSAGSLDDGKTDISAMCAAPFLCMDGVNEAGLALAILALDTEADWRPVSFESWKVLAEGGPEEPLMLENSGDKPQQLDRRSKAGRIAVNEKDRLAWKLHRQGVWQKTAGKPTLFHPVLMRRMLDFCATADEAAAMAKNVNVKTPIADRDYHIVITDRSGKTIVLEWQNNELIITEARHLTNFYLCREDRYGAGYERDNILDIALKRYPEKMKEDYAMHVLAAASADPDLDPSVTQYSVIYNTAKASMDLWAWRNYVDKFSFSLND